MEKEASSDSKSQRKENLYLKILIYTIAMVLSISQALAYLQRYRETPTHTTYRTEEREEFLAPKLSICQYPAWKVTDLPRDWENETAYSFMSKFGFQVGEVVTGCTWNMTSCNSAITWAEMIRYKSRLQPPLQRCFTLHPKRPLGVLDKMSGYVFVLTMKPETESLIKKKAHWKILLHKDPYWASSMEGTFTVVKIFPRTSNTVLLSMREMLYLPTPAHPCEPDSSYSRDWCWSNCVARSLNLTCQLSWMNLSLPLCEGMKDVQGLLARFYPLTRKNRYLNLGCRCPPPCTKKQFNVQVMPVEEREARGPISHVHIYFPSREVEVLVELESYSLTQMVGELGGCIGMFLGVSLISIYEFIARYSWQPRKISPSGPMIA